MAFSFEKLIVWQKAIELATNVHELTLGFPKDERYILTSQIKRASDSVALNIAEGSTGQSKKEFNRFLGIALRSAIEVVSCLYLAKNRNLISKEEFGKFYLELEELVKMIQALRKSLKL
ncbi:MAG: four helix bundle protein [Flavobacteriales bacterium]|nr:four helix bundle protein [Flavobacteriales bacterium]